MCISVKKIQRTKFDVSQKPLIQKMHTEPEILNWMVGGVILYSDLHLCDSPRILPAYQVPALCTHESNERVNFFNHVTRIPPSLETRLS